MFLQHEIGKMIKPNIWLQENQFNVVNFFFAVPSKQEWHKQKQPLELAIVLCKNL